MSDIQALERQLTRAKDVVAQRDLMLRLSENHDFRKLIIDGFLKEECARFAHMSTDPNLGPQDRADALGSAQAAGHLKRWINALILQGNVAERDIVDLNEALEEARAEESNEE
jgi:hypothetical protein